MLYVLESAVSFKKCFPDSVCWVGVHSTLALAEGVNSCSSGLMLIGLASLNTDGLSSSRGSLSSAASVARAGPGAVAVPGDLVPWGSGVVPSLRPLRFKSQHVRASHVCQELRVYWGRDRPAGFPSLSPWGSL